MGVLRRKDTGERFVFVSTHLARNPESLKQQGLRLRQVAQLMRELHTFYKEQNIDTAEVPAIVAGDLNAESLQEVTAVAAAVCGLRDLDVHPLLFASTSTPSTRCLLDGVAMPVPHRSTEPARPHRAPDTLVDFHTARDGRRHLIRCEE